MVTKRISNLVLILISLLGLALLLYPTVANQWNQRHNSRAIASYTELVKTVDDSKYVEMWKAARLYNQHITDFTGHELTEELRQEYESVLDPTGLGILGYVEIPSLKIDLPIYHGTSDSVLQIASGHLDWTNLPIGGVGTHCAISGHRGLSSAKLFTDLPQLKKGDVFYIRVLDELLTYEVDHIATVWPWELDALDRVEGKDYFTLITCTPYGINTHRLLVRGHRIANTEEARHILVIADALRIEPLLVAPILAGPIVLTLIILVFLAPVPPPVEPKKGIKL